MQSLTNKPTVGMPATICYHSDRIPATVIKVSKNATKIWLQEDLAIRIDKNGISDSQTYEYFPHKHGAIHIATLRKQGNYKILKSSQLISLGERYKFYDFNY